MRVIVAMKHCIMCELFNHFSRSTFKLKHSNKSFLTCLNFLQTLKHEWDNINGYMIAVQDLSSHSSCYLS